MAELFLCRGEPVHLSNGGTAALFEEWERLAREDAGRPGMANLADYLHRTMNYSGVGCMAFGLDRQYLPGELAGPAESAALLRVAERTARNPTLIRGVNWSPELLDMWYGVLVRMARALRESCGGRRT
ncbi:MAG: hypothetical protein K2X87_19485 [Gemmataceae bacterium]|nr:hypothetical protein [Gemmataceae bacterium]